MTDQEQINQVAKIYEAFGKGDVPFIVSCLDPNVEWEFNSKKNYSIPWHVPGTGHKTVTQFFEGVARELDIKKFNILGINKIGQYVVDLVEIEAKIRSTGKTLEDFEVHVWKFNDKGLISHFRHVIDTLHHQESARSS